MFFKPVFKQWRYSPRKTNNCVTGKLRACFCTCIQDLRNFVIRESRNDRRNHHANGNVRRTKLADRIEAAVGRRSTRLQYSLQTSVERGHRDVYCRRIASRKFAEEIDIARNEMILGDDRDRIAKFGKHFKTVARNAQLSLDRLIGVGHAAHDKRLWLPTR